MTTLAPPSVPREALWDDVERAYAQVRLAQVEHGDTSAEARTARRMVSMAWMAYETGAASEMPTRPVIVHRPLVAEVEIQLTVDLDDMGYSVSIALDGHGSDAVDVTMTPVPELGGVALLALATVNVLTALEAAAAGRDDVRSGDLFSRAIIGLTLWRQGWIAAQLDDTAA